MFNLLTKSQCKSHAALLLVGALLGASAGTCAGADAPTKANAHTITIEMMQFSPKTIEVNVGDKVIWKNKDLVPHTVTADNKAFNSGNIPINRSWEFVAHKKGTFPYSCTLHPTMKGTLIVK